MDDAGVRESVGVLCERQEGYPAATGALGRTLVLDQDLVDRGMWRCVVSCASCAGQPLGFCVDAGHDQQVREGG